MKFRIAFQPRAVIEMQDAIDYYDSKLVGLGEAFYIELFEYIEAISENPFYKIHSQNIRVLPLSRFPYIIFYWIDESLNTVYIEAIFHTSQNTSRYPDKT